MNLTTIFLLILGVTVALLLVWSRCLREEVRATERQVSALEAEREMARSQQAQLVRFLAGLAIGARRFYAAASEREIPGILIETAVEALAPRAALVAVRRRRADSVGQCWVVAAVHPHEASPAVGCELSWSAPVRERNAAPVQAVYRLGQTAMPQVLPASASPAELPTFALEWVAPMVAESEAVGVIALSSTAAAPEITETIVGALASFGATAFAQAVARQRARTSAQIDELTLLFNRRHILRVLSDEIRRSHQQGHELSVFLFDIDHFKHYNDANGHMAGDILLRLLAELVLKNVRASDTLGRFGGEEFLVVLPHTAVGQALRVANSLRTLISGLDLPASSRQPQGAVTVSGGVAQFPVHGTSVSTLLRAADQALYAAKHAGRNRVACADVAPLDVHYESPNLEEELD